MTLEQPVLSPELAWSELLQGYERFRDGRSDGVSGSRAAVTERGAHLKPIAAVVACSDSRTAPEIVFDQPVGKLFVARVPGNVAADSVQWALDIAVQSAGVRLVVVLGHTQCLAIKQVVDGDVAGVAGLLLPQVHSAVLRARGHACEDLWVESVYENVRESATRLAAGSTVLQRALTSGQVKFALAVYRVEDGTLDVVAGV